MIGDRLKLLRSTLNLSQRETASKNGISYSTYRNLEANQRTPSYTNLITLADFFAVSIDYLMGRSDDIDVKDYGEMYANLRENAYEKYLLAHKTHNKENTRISAEYPYNLLERIYRNMKYPFTTILSDDQKKGLEWALSTLTDKQIKIIEERFKHGKTLREIGKEMGVSGEYIRHTEWKAVCTLRNPSHRTSIEKGYEAARLEKELTNIEKLKIKIEQELEELDELKKLKEKYNIKPDGHFSLSIDDIELPTRAYNALKRAGCTTVEQILERFKNKSIYRIRNLGEQSVKDVATKIYEHTGIILPTKEKPIEDNIKNNIVYTLFSCDEWKSYNSMRIIGIYSCPKTLYDRVREEIKNKNMEYMDEEELPEDPNEFDKNLLIYGYIEQFELDA